MLSFKKLSRFRQQRRLLLATPVGTVTIAANNYARQTGIQVIPGPMLLIYLSTTIQVKPIL